MSIKLLLNFPKIRLITEDEEILKSELENFIAKNKKNNVNFELDNEKKMIRKTLK